MCKYISATRGGIPVSTTTTTTTTTTMARPVGGADHVGAPGDAPSSPPPSGDAATATQDAAGESACSIALRLDALLLQAAKLTTRSVEATEVRSTLRALPENVKGAIAAAADEAKKAMDKLARYTGCQIGMALLPDGDPEVVAALNSAVEAQGELSLKLHDLVRRPGLDDALFDAVMDMALTCDRRQSEIYPLALQLADAVNHSRGDKQVAELLGQRFDELLPRQAVTMHGTADVYESLKNDLQPLSDRLDDFAARPNASLTSEELSAYSIEAWSAAVTLNSAVKRGVPVAEESPERVMPSDKALLMTAAKMVGNASQRLKNVRRSMGLASLKHFADTVFGLPSDMPTGFVANLPSKIRKALNALGSLRRCMCDVAKDYADKPDDASKLQTLRSLCGEYMQKARELGDVSGAIKSSLRPSDSAAQGGTGSDEIDRVAAAFAHASGMYTQVEHFVQMVNGVNKDMTPEQFLSTTSARALMEGRLDFPTLVEARVHGMSDGDVNPDLDDFRPHEHSKLGKGFSSTVYLVKYTDDDSEWVFKPEAPGRQGIAGLALSKGYVPDQQIAHLNLATQDAAKALGAEDVSTSCSVGAHQGQYGLFMEKAPGVDAHAFGHGDPVPPGSLTSQQVQGLDPEKYARVVGGIMRGINRLEWLDLVTGQGDRHSRNYMIDVRDGSLPTVSVKGIDNDMCFPGYRTGLRTYTLKGRAVDSFNYALERFDPLSAAILLGPNSLRQVIGRDRGVSSSDGGRTIVLDTTKFESAEAHYLTAAVLGLQGASLPGYIDEEFYKQLVSLKAEEGQRNDKRERYLASLARRIPPDAVDAARNRLDEAIRLAEEFRRDPSGRVVSEEEFMDPKVQRTLVRRELEIPLPRQSTQPSPYLDADAVKESARRQARSIFVRDIFSHIKKKGWFDDDRDEPVA